MRGLATTARECPLAADVVPRVHPVRRKSPESTPKYMPRPRHPRIPMNLRPRAVRPVRPSCVLCPHRRLQAERTTLYEGTKNGQKVN
jgi:hypothetical protein